MKDIFFCRIGNCVLYGKKPPCEHSSHWDDALSTQRIPETCIRKVFICLRQNALGERVCQGKLYATRNGRIRTGGIAWLVLLRI
jgi:hypothetical protein